MAATVTAMVAVAVCLVAAAPSLGQRGTSPRNVWGPAPQPSTQAREKLNRLIADVHEPEVTLDLDPQRSRILRTKRKVARLSVTDPDVLEVTQFSPTEYELIGKTTGQTSLTFWFAAENGEPEEMLRYFVRVSPDEAVEDRRRIEYTELQRKINEFFPDSIVQLIPVADKLIIRGQARDAEEASEIMSLIRGQGPDQSGGRLSGNEGLAAEPYPGTDRLPPANVINMLHVPGEMQVMLKVRVAELSRTALREMGAELSIRDVGDFTFDSLLGLDGVVSAVLNTDEVELTLEALSTNSYAKVLAEPNLVTLSGHSASFIAGGEFAVPVVVGVEGAAAATTNFRGFGTQVLFTPTVLDKDRIRLQVAPSLTALNDNNTVDGIPGLDTRAVSTTVDLREGQWLAIAGLLQDQQSGSKARVPLLGDIPYLDSVFGNKEVRREETELIVLVSPELVHPLEAEEAPRILPGMEVTEPTDWALYLGGSIEGRPGCDYRSTVGRTLRRQMVDAHLRARHTGQLPQSESYFVQGEYGFSE